MLQDGCFFKENREVTPHSLQNKVRKKLRIGQLCIIKIKSLPRSLFYWKNIGRDIEQITKNCKQYCIK